MEKKELDRLLHTEQLKKEGIDVWSDAYLFDVEFAQSRNERIDSDNPWPFYRTRLSLLMREGMDDERRGRIFASPFDLGSLFDIPKSSRNRVGLLLDIKDVDPSTLGKGERDGYQPGDFFETIFKRISQHTGRTIAEHEKINKTSALRVVKLLHTLMETRNNRLLQFLTLPEHEEGKFSLALRAAHPHEKLHELNWLLGDLKGRLSVELKDDFFLRLETLSARIYSFFNELVQTACDILERSRMPIEGYVDIYRKLAQEIADLPPLVDENGMLVPGRLQLDEEFYFYLHELEFVHFAVAYTPLVVKAIPEEKITPIFDEMQALLVRVFPDASHIKQLVVPVKDVSDFLVSTKDDVLVMIQKAFGFEVDRTAYTRHAESAQRLLIGFYKARGSDGIRLDVTVKKTSILYCLSVIFAVYYSALKGGEFAPFLPGQGSQSDRIGLSNRKAMPNETVKKEKMPEEHVLIWHTRIEYFLTILQGNPKDSFLGLLGFKAELFDKIWDLYATHDLDCIETGIVHIHQYIQAYLLEIIDEVIVDSTQI